MLCIALNRSSGYIDRVMGIIRVSTDFQAFTSRIQMVFPRPITRMCRTLDSLESR